MRILQLPLEVAGQVALTAHGLRTIGQTADALFEPHPFGYGLPPDLRPIRRRGALGRLGPLVDLLGLAQRYDVFHFHFARSLLREGFRHLDALLLRLAGHRVLVEFWGSDVRLPSVEAARNRHYVNSYAEDEAVNRRRLARWARATGGEAVVCDHTLHAFLRPHFDRVHVVRQRVDTGALCPCYPDPAQRRPLVVHAPSQRAFKGSEFVQRAVERLRSRGVPFDYREVHGLPHPQALELYRRADLIVDQLRIGYHGVFAVEAMALGKPVICHILPELLPTYPEGFPVIQADLDSIEAVLEDWIQRPADRHRLGVQSRQYAERVHDYRVVARRLVEIYAGRP